MAYTKIKTNKKICQGCIESFEPTEIYTVLTNGHYIFLCEPCMTERGTTGKLFKEPKTKKAKV